VVLPVIERNFPPSAKEEAKEESLEQEEEKREFADLVNKELEDFSSHDISEEEGETFAFKAEATTEEIRRTKENDEKFLNKELQEKTERMEEEFQKMMMELQMDREKRGEDGG